MSGVDGRDGETDFKVSAPMVVSVLSVPYGEPVSGGLPKAAATL